MGKQQIVELNGQKYDAVTGSMISQTPVPAKQSKPKPIVAHNMDGFNRAPKHNLPHHNPEKSKTLMRRVVNKPNKPVESVSDSKPQKNQITTTSSTLSSHQRRNLSIKKNPLVSRFSQQQNSINKTQLPQQSHTKPNYPVSVSKNTSEKTPDHILKALANADSHQQPKLKKAKRRVKIAHKLKISQRMLSGISFSVAFLIIGGFIAYQNAPGISMKLAVSKSGVSANIPKYQPSGFSLNGNIAYKPGQVTINYKSNSDNRNYNVSQSTTSWNSSSLLENFVAVNRKDYQTVQDKGKTVYIYDDNATWVDGGIWYRVEGESKLNSDQLLHIAASL